MNKTYQHKPCPDCGYHLVTGQAFDTGPDGKPVVVKIARCPRCGREERI